MKHLKTYNESLRDKMKPKEIKHDDVINHINTHVDWDLDDKLEFLKSLNLNPLDYLTKKSIHDKLRSYINLDHKLAFLHCYDIDYNEFFTDEEIKDYIYNNLEKEDEEYFLFRYDFPENFLD